MENISKPMIFAAKEEILRNVVKTHTAILIEGWTGTGKTVTTLKAVKGMGDIYYYTETADEDLRHLGQYSDRITVVNKVGALRDLPAGKQCLVFDDLNRLGSEARFDLETMIRDRVKGRKVIVITQVVLDAQSILENMDVVVRFKHNTAEVMHSKLSDMDSLG
ncbi:MAG: ATP-binding protein [Nitrospirae bacterium]|nr:ATP-binding protein [Nitrospirota bacterium]